MGENPDCRVFANLASHGIELCSCGLGFRRGETDGVFQNSAYAKAGTTGRAFQCRREFVPMAIPVFFSQGFMLEFSASGQSISVFLNRFADRICGKTSEIAFGTDYCCALGLRHVI